MATYRCWSGSGVTQRANSTVYNNGDRMQPATTDTSTNHAVAKRYVWECTAGGGGSSGASVPAWSASYTPDSSTITDGALTWTCRNPGYSSGSTVDWTFASLFVFYLNGLVAAGDTVLVHYTSQEAANAATASILPAANNVHYMSVNKDASEVYTPMGTSGYLCNTSSAAQTVVARVGGPIRVDGLTFRTTGSSSAGIGFGSADDCQIYGKDIRIENKAAASGVPYTTLGGSADQRSKVFVSNLVVEMNNTGQSIKLSDRGEIIGLSFAGAAVSDIFELGYINDAAGANWKIFGMDASTVVSSTAALVLDTTVTGGRVEFIDCILPSSYAVISGAGNLNEAGVEVLLTNCKAGATSGIHAYHNALGSMERNTTVTYNGESFSWRIDASSAATRNAPFRTPWFWGEITTGSSTTPRFEILRNDSATALTDVQVWCERAAAVTSGSPIKTFASSAPAYTSAGSNLAAGAGLGSWAGESGTAWSGKVDAGAITPIGDECLMRLCVATTTPVYVSQGWVV